MAPVTRPQCGAPPPAPPPDTEAEDKPRQDPELPHDYRCNLEFHKRWEIDQSRRQFNWKVVEPYDGKCRMHRGCLTSILLDSC